MKRDIWYTDGNYSNSGFGFEEYNKDGKYISGCFCYTPFNTKKYEIYIYIGRYSDSPEITNFDDIDEAVKYFNITVNPECKVSSNEIVEYENIWKNKNN